MMAVLLGHTPERTCRPPHRTPALLPRALVAVAVALRAVIAVGRGEEEKKRG
jgi:hypothetical protein